VRLASASEKIHDNGAEVIAVSTDDAVRQAGMFSRWPTPNVLYVPDPGGEKILGPLGLMDPEDARNIALPAMIVIAPDGTEVYRYVGRDFADRTTDDEVYAAVAGLGLEPIDVPPGGPVAEFPDDLRGFFKVDDLVPYFKGTRSGARAIKMRADDPEFKASALQHESMADSTLDAYSVLTR
jgi:hypothetical protein